MDIDNGEWWNYSWNFAPGCTKVSPECANCWALIMANRLQAMKKPGYEGLVEGRGSKVKWTGLVNLLNWRLGDVVRITKPCVVAVNLMGDLFHEGVPLHFIQAVFDVMEQANQHTYMVLTKRPERMAQFISAGAGRAPLPNVRLGTTAGTQQTANEHWSSMAYLAQQGWTTWVSAEPLLEQVDWHGWSFLKRMVDGGESGAYARVTPTHWYRANRDWCQGHGVEYWHKQNGEWGNAECRMQNAEYPVTTMAGEKLYRVGRKLAGRLLDGEIYGGLK